MLFPWQRRFRELVRTQLALFENEYGELVSEARAALVAYNAEHDSDLAMELYERYDDLAEDVEDALEFMCERMASTMEPRAAKQYRTRFEHDARSVYRDLLPRMRFGDERDRL
jgi:hypothetical protein